ncbi:MFS transporter [Amycolatopsis sp. A133]|uniref:MFS transporter n=1 Tax=Amycolatopsis sp. A133 TaxID=3064472 RepID=UPI0027F59F96|nr:MFS transporter [Amycolatopsis sp. A133]MDQ7810296.1 MFS transporter [Amycolatopsis sp. A133]
MTVTEIGAGRDPRRWAALVLLCMASFMMILDSQIVILALPAIQQGLDMAPGAAQWILTANAITFGGLLLLGGRMADLLGRRLVFMLGVGGFLGTSLVSGLAWNGDVLVGARALHGLSSALMVPSALSILMNTFPEGRERNRAIAAWSAVGGIGATAGLLVGGQLTTALGWQWVFLVNVPVVLAVLVVSPFILRESRDHGRRRTFDLAGAVTSTGALLVLIYALVNAPAAGWGSGRTLGLFGAAAVLIALFFVIEARSAAPLVPLPLLRRRSVLTGNLLMGLVAMVAWGEGVLISLHTQQVLGYTAFQSGLASCVMPILAVLGAYIGQALVTRRGFRLAAAAAALVLGLACALLARIPVDGRFAADILLPLVLFGLGLGVGNTTASIVALDGVAEPESGLASGLNSAGFQIGGAFGVALVTTVAVAVSAGSTEPARLAAGFHAGFVALVIVAAVTVATALFLPAFVRRAGSRPTAVPAADELGKAA